MANKLSFFALLQLALLSCMPALCSNKSTNHLDITGLCSNTQKIVASYLQSDWIPEEANACRQPVLSYAGQHYLKLINLNRPIQSHIAYSPNGEYTAVSEKNGTVRIYQTRNNAELQTIQSGWTCSAVLAFVSDAQLLIAMKHRLLLFDIKSGSYLSFNAYTADTAGNERIKKLACSSDGRYIAVGFDDGSIDILKDFKIVFQIDGNGNKTAEITGLAFTKDSKHLIATTIGGDLFVRELLGYRQQQSKKFVFGVHDLQCSPRNPAQIVITTEKKIVLYDLPSQSILWFLPCIQQAGFVTARYSYDGKLLFVALTDGTIEIYDIDELHRFSLVNMRIMQVEPLATIQAHTEAVGCIDCAPRSYEFMSMGISDFTVKQWKTMGDIILCGNQSRNKNIAKKETVTLRCLSPNEQIIDPMDYVPLNCLKYMPYFEASVCWIRYLLGFDKELIYENFVRGAAFNLATMPVYMKLSPPEDALLVAKETVSISAACFAIAGLNIALNYFLLRKKDSK